MSDAVLKNMIHEQMRLCVKLGVNDDFHSGYVCALHWIWTSAGYSATGTTLAAEALFTGGIVGIVEGDSA